MAPLAVDFLASIACVRERWALMVAAFKSALKGSTTLA